MMNRDELIAFATQLGLVARLREMGVPAIALFDQPTDNTDGLQGYERGAFIFDVGDAWEYFAPPTPKGDQRLSTEEVKQWMAVWAKDKWP